MIRPFACAVLLVTLIVVAYHNSLDGPVVLDDAATVVDNESIRQLWPLGRVLVPPNDAGVGGRPLANLSFALSYAAGHGDVRAHHAFNVALHGLAGLTLFGLVRRTLLTPTLRPRFGDAATPLALAIAALWIAHPLATSAVDYISQRTELLMALCYLLTLYAFVRWSERPSGGAWALVALVACACGMASKEVMATVPLMALLYDRTFLSGSWRGALQRHWTLHAGLAATWVLLGALVFVSRLGDRGVGFDQGVPVLPYALTECSAVLRYLQLSLWPHPLVFDYGWAFVTGSAAVPGVIGCATLVGGVIYLVARRPIAGFAGAWFLLLLAPTSTFVPIAHQPIAESRAYLPLAGVLAALVLGAYALAGRRALLLATFATLAGLTATIQRNTVYQSDIALMHDTAVKRPDNARAHCNLGVALASAGRDADVVVPHYLAAIRLKPDYPEANSNLAAWLIDAGRAAEALPHLNLALQVQENFVDAYTNRGKALMQLGRRQEAVADFEAAVRFRPNHFNAHNDLCAALLELGRLPESLAHGETAVRLAPDVPVVHFNLGNALSAAQRVPEAIAHYRTALQLEPAFPRAEHNLAVALLRTGDVRGAIEHFETALRLKPDYAEAKKNLEIVLKAGAK